MNEYEYWVVNAECQMLNRLIRTRTRILIFIRISIVVMRLGRVDGLSTALGAGGKTLTETEIELRTRQGDWDEDDDDDEDECGTERNRTERNECHVNVIQVALVAWSISAAQSVALICVSVRYSSAALPLTPRLSSQCQFPATQFYLPLM